VGDGAQHAEGQPPRAASQTAAFFTATSPTTTTTRARRDSLDEGERLAARDGDKHIVFMKNHGVLRHRRDGRAGVPAPVPARARLPQPGLALSTGRPLEVLPDEIAARVQTPNPEDTHPRADRERLFFEAMMRVLDRELPGYRD
jgi:hypothetical protein